MTETCWSNLMTWKIRALYKFLIPFLNSVSIVLWCHCSIFVTVLTFYFYDYNPMHVISFTFYHDFHYFIIALNSSNCINCEKRRWAVQKNRLSEHDNESCKLNVIPCLCLCRLLNNIPFHVIFINMNKRMGQFFEYKEFIDWQYLPLPKRHTLILHLR